MDPFFLFDFQLQVEILIEYTVVLNRLVLFVSTQYDFAFSLKHTGRLPCFPPPYLKAGWSRAEGTLSQLQRCDICFAQRLCSLPQ